jgi:RNA polymerase Rpb2, domain 6/RNA polymerase Rpb1, domain 2/RNA polymerase Rpb2, domain 3
MAGSALTSAIRAPWHHASFAQFLDERLPRLLEARLPLASYHVEPTDIGSCDLHVALTSGTGIVTVAYHALPRPDEEGIFTFDGKRRVVVPVASRADLGPAAIRCVGEQLYDFLEQRVGTAPADLTWDEALLRAWLPLDGWMRAFLGQRGEPLDETNWLARQTHLRRLRMPRGAEDLTPGHFGRTCPFETPENPNIGRLLTIAVGAEIRDGRLIVVDDRPEAALGLSAAAVPFLEHSEVPRLTMGVNMMRQWLPPPDPEPALVRTGLEPETAQFWCGRSLLTAYISWGEASFEDQLVISASCARRLAYPCPIEPGDKLSNRHGSKGVVSRILPDDEMPHLADGSPVEIVYNMFGLPSRMNFGQLREAVMGRIARTEGTPVCVPPFQAPDDTALRERLRQAGLPESGMETLTQGREGEPLARPSTVGWVYWGRLAQVARRALFAAVDGTRTQRLGEAEYFQLRDAGAVATIRDFFNSPSLPVASPAPQFADLVRRLEVAGVRVTSESDRLVFGFAPPADEAEEGILRLACPVRHPWLYERSLSAVGVFPAPPEYAALERANTAMERLLASHAPASLTQRAFAELEACTGAFLDALLTPSHLRFRARVLAVGRAVIAAGLDQSADQVGLPDEIAWTLFGPLLLREVGDEAEVGARGPRAAEALDAIMARSWVLGFNGRSHTTRSFLALRPRRIPGRVVRIHPLVCSLWDVDFDGDEATILLPTSEAAQRELGERLSPSGALARDPGLIQSLRPMQDALWGLASQSLADEGQASLAELAGLDIAGPDGFVTKGSLVQALRTLLDRDGVNAALEAADRLMRRGFEEVRASGASLSPFFGATLPRPPAPPDANAAAWDAYTEKLGDHIAARTDYLEHDLGPQVLAVKSGARATIRQLVCIAGSRGTLQDVHGRPLPIRHGWREGLTPEEMFAVAVATRRALVRWHEEWRRLRDEVRHDSLPRGFHVLARAMRARRPGIVFAHAAATGELDPLTDLDSRLFVGLPDR